ncbi:MAG: hypothetical protein MZV64_52430, partial [Ignavibacteriales bacterium]|nr:hypothetical protein [Ignavibacteriales bacterium]
MVSHHILKILEQQLASEAVLATATAYPTAVALKEAGSYTIPIIGGRSREYVILEDEMKQVCVMKFIQPQMMAVGAEEVVGVFVLTVMRNS